MSGSEALTLRTVRSPSRPWESVLMLKASDPSPSRMLYAMRALSPRSGSWARNRPTRVPGPAVSTTENWYRPWGGWREMFLERLPALLPPPARPSPRPGWGRGGRRLLQRRQGWGGVVKGWLRWRHWPLTLRELGGIVVDIAEGDCHRGAARQPPHVAAHVLGLNHH